MACGRLTLLNPQATSFQDISQQIRPIGDQTVYPEIKQLVHLGFFVDRPHVNLKIAPMRGPQESTVHYPQPSIFRWDLRETSMHRQSRNPKGQPARRPQQAN